MSCRFSSIKPGCRRTLTRFKSPDGIGVLQCLADLVQPLHQRVTPEPVNLETPDATVGMANFTGLQIDRQVQGRSLRVLHQHLDRIRFQHQGQDAVLKAVAKENIGVTLGDDDTEPIVGQRPHGMLP